MTRKQITEALDGLDPSTVGSVLRATGPVRHQHRVEAAWAAAREAAGHHDPHIRALLWLEGQLAREWQDTPGITPPTKRLAPFRGLGTGRRHAGDGAAWTAAIRAAVWRHTGAWSRLVGVDIDARQIEDGGPAVLAVVLAREDGDENVVPVEGLGLDRDDLGQIARWAAREAVRREDRCLLLAAGRLMASLAAEAAPTTESATAD